MNKTDFASLLGKNKGENQVQKQMIIYTTPLEDNIKETLKTIASKGYGSLKPTLITIEEVKKAINEYKQENQIYSDINMNNVTELSLSFKRILKIENLDNLVKLEKLKLDNNMIMKIQNLDSLVNIKWLDLSFNNISVIEGLDKLVNLTDLSLFNNQITTVSGLDNCKKLNVLSVGKNQIKNPRPMVEYLRKFSNLQALTVHENPFCKDDGSQSAGDPSKNYQYPGSYEIILAILEKLKYLDYRPIDPELRKLAFDHFKTQNQKERSDVQYKLDEEKEKAAAKMAADLKHANAEAVLDFYKNIDQKINEDTNNKEKIKKLAGFDDKMRQFEKHIEENLNIFKKEIIQAQEEKDLVIKSYEAKFEHGQEKYVEECKMLINEFKKKFKKFCANIPNNLNSEEIEKEIGLRSLKEKLYEIEAHLKFTISETYKLFEKEIKEKNHSMGDKTEKLKNELGSYKETLKKNLTSLKDELLQKAEEGVELSDSIAELVDDPDLGSDLDKINEVYDDKINNLRDQIENSRQAAYDAYHKNFLAKENYRNRRRIEDINEIYEFYNNKLREAIEKSAEEKKRNQEK